MEYLRIIEVVLGISLVIFVHELGHYLAARWCGVRVETFSLGFGPRLFGWRRGPTLYQVAIIPLGGYCRMAGEERRFDGAPPEPDDLNAKSVGQRFFIYSGGVLMNVAFGLIVFPILFHVGVPFLRPLVGESKPGSPAWHARLPRGAEVKTVNGNHVFDFLHIPTEVALGDPNRAEIVLVDPETGRDKTFELQPKKEADAGIGTIGVRPALDRDAEGRVLLEIPEGGPAWNAGLRTGDRLSEVVGGIRGLGPFEQIALQGSSGSPLQLRVLGPDGERIVSIEPELSEELLPPRVGISPPLNLVFDVRSSPLTEALGILPDDRIETVQGVPLRRLGDLQQTLLELPGELALGVRRGDEELSLLGPVLDEGQALAFASDLALTQDLETNEVVVQLNGPAYRAGLRDGDRVLAVDESDVTAWSHVTELVGAAAREGRSAVFSLERPGLAPDEPPRHLRLSARAEEHPVPLYGISLRQAEYIYRADSIPQAVGFGVYCSWKFLQDSWLTLKRMVLRDVSPKNMGGIITIGAVSFTLAESGWPKLFFFLCLLSINLAFLNVLPIPVLDGGHLFFLVVEKIKGSPVSERVLGYSQMIGVVLILSLMVYVTYNDLVRWVFPS